MNVDNTEIKKLPRFSTTVDNWQLRHMTVLTQRISYYFDLIENPIGKRILEEIKKDSRVQALKYRMISTGTGSRLFDEKSLGVWFLWACHEYGTKIAKSYLNKYLDSEKVPIINTVWVIGIEVEKTIELENGVCIVPIEEMPESEDKEHLLIRQIGDRHDHYSPKSKAAIIHNSEAKKSQSQSELDPRKNQKFPAAESFLLIHKIVILLNAFKDISCMSYWNTTYISPKMPLGIFGGSFGNGPIYDVAGDHISKLDASTANEINDLFKKYQKLTPDRLKLVNVALSRLSQAKRRTQLEDKIIDLCIAFEIILTKSSATNDQLSLSFRLRGSWFIGEDYKQRDLIYNKLKELYNYRGQIVHGNILNQKKSDAAFKNFNECVHLAEKAIQKLIYQGNVDWDGLLLGKTT